MAISGERPWKEAAVTPHSFLPFGFDSQQHQQLLTGLVARKEKGGKKWERQDKLGRDREREPDEMIHYMHGK